MEKVVTSATNDVLSTYPREVIARSRHWVRKGEHTKSLVLFGGWQATCRLDCYKVLSGWGAVTLAAVPICQGGGQ
jgi:hypothetical protein